MRLWKKISIYFIYPAFMLAVGLGAGLTVQEFFYPNRQPSGQESSAQEGAAEGKTGKAGETQAGKGQAEEEPLQAAGGQEQVITADTRYVVERFDLADSSRTREEEPMPEQYIGMDREQFLDACEVYEASPSLEDANRGFLSMYVERFSAKEVVVRKNYESSTRPEEFYLAVENNYVVVYEADRKTRFMSTGIPVQSLSDELAKELLNFKYVGSEEELYDFLESYSS
ncbi:MAG TPA: hypothetical protein H9700_04645 [Candidatus Eisenbergiella intestinipullorum]|nr:hypothetical protein [Candidatus Eisenbergiella intestinipullorum]